MADLTVVAKVPSGSVWDPSVADKRNADSELQAMGRALYEYAQQSPEVPDKWPLERIRMAGLAEPVKFICAAKPAKGCYINLGGPGAGRQPLHLVDDKYLVVHCGTWCEYAHSYDSSECRTHPTRRVFRARLLYAQRPGGMDVEQGKYKAPDGWSSSDKKADFWVCENNPAIYFFMPTETKGKDVRLVEAVQAMYQDSSKWSQPLKLPSGSTKSEASGKSKASDMPQSADVRSRDTQTTTSFRAGTSSATAAAATAHKATRGSRKKDAAALNPTGSAADLAHPCASPPDDSGAASTAELRVLEQPSSTPARTVTTEGPNHKAALSPQSTGTGTAERSGSNASHATKITEATAALNLGGQGSSNLVNGQDDVQANLVADAGPKPQQPSAACTPLRVVPPLTQDATTPPPSATPPLRLLSAAQPSPVPAAAATYHQPSQLSAIQGFEAEGTAADFKELPTSVRTVLAQRLLPDDMRKESLAAFKELVKVHIADLLTAQGKRTGTNILHWLVVPAKQGMHSSFDDADAEKLQAFLDMLTPEQFKDLVCKKSHTQNMPWEIACRYGSRPQVLTTLLKQMLSRKIGEAKQVLGAALRAACRYKQSDAVKQLLDIANAIIGKSKDGVQEFLDDDVGEHFVDTNESAYQELLFMKECAQQAGYSTQRLEDCALVVF